MAKFNPAAQYAAGLVGCMADPRSDEVFADYLIRKGGDPDGGRVSRYWEIMGAGAGKLSALWLVIDQVYPGAWPGPAQLVGDCVSKGCANALMLSLCAEVVEGRPDEVTGDIESAPEVSDVAVANIPIASESLYAWRGSNGHGWVCSEAAKVACEKGFLIRKPYPELGFDLTKYTTSTLKLGGAKPPDNKWLEESKKHVARTATFLKGREQVRSFLAAGYGIFTCSSLGFSDRRNEDGVSKQNTVWNHSQALAGYDDRPETHEKYGQALVLWINSWGAKWVSGSRKVLNSTLEIPHGSYWALADTIDRASCIALSSVAGWPRRKLPDYGSKGKI